jgi:hypothetical protein
MSRRRIGQEAFAFGSSDIGRRSSLDDLRDLIDWAPIERRLGSLSCSAKGVIEIKPQKRKGRRRANGRLTVTRLSFRSMFLKLYNIERAEAVLPTLVR